MDIQNSDLISFGLMLFSDEVRPDDAESESKSMNMFITDTLRGLHTDLSALKRSSH